MKNNKLFNKVLSKSAMLLMVAGVTMGQGAVFNVYAQDISTESTTQEVTTTNTNSEENNVSEANETANVVAEARCVQFNWSKPVISAQNCRPNVVVKPSRPNRPNRPSTNKPSTDTNKPSTETPGINQPNTDTNKPSTETPDTNKPNTDTPSVDTPAEDNGAVSNQTAFENEVLRLVNVERAKQGLSALQMDESVRNVARVKATDMYKNRYFDHTSPTYGTPFEMLKKYGISYRAAAENIAKGQKTPQQVVNSWMNSSGHRANILNAKYTHIGIGYEANGNHWVQMFISK